MFGRGMAAVGAAMIGADGAAGFWAAGVAGLGERAALAGETARPACAGGAVVAGVGMAGSGTAAFAGACTEAPVGGAVTPADEGLPGTGGGVVGNGACGCALPGACGGGGVPESAADDKCTDVAGAFAALTGGAAVGEFAGGWIDTSVARTWPCAWCSDRVSVAPTGGGSGNCRVSVCRPTCTCVVPLADWASTLASTFWPATCASARNVALACASGMGGSCEEKLIDQPTPAPPCDRQSLTQPRAVVSGECLYIPWWPACRGR